MVPTSRPQATRTTSTTTKQHYRRANSRRHSKHKDLPSVRFGAMLKKAAVDHRALQWRPSLTHSIRHNNKSNLLVRYLGAMHHR